MITFLSWLKACNSVMAAAVRSCGSGGKLRQCGDGVGVGLSSGECLLLSLSVFCFDGEEKRDKSFSIFLTNRFLNKV